jgi:hypothetical protein
LDYFCNGSDKRLYRRARRNVVNANATVVCNSAIAMKRQIIAIFALAAACLAQIAYVGGATASAASSGDYNSMPFTGYSATSGHAIVIGDIAAGGGIYPYNQGADISTVFPAAEVSAGSLTVSATILPMLGTIHTP